MSRRTLRTSLLLIPLVVGCSVGAAQDDSSETEAAAGGWQSGTPRTRIDLGSDRWHDGHGQDSVGGAGGAGLVLPLFDCSDPMFFPLRIDERGEGIEPAAEAPEEEPDGAAGASSELGDGDLTVLLVFDKSGSMASPWGGKSRWQAGSDALLLGLDGILDELTIAALYFPFEGEGAAPGCGVPGLDAPEQIGFRSGRDFKRAWIDSACASLPDGSTPLQRALEVADEAVDQAQQQGLTKQRFRVILVTDGAPTCDDDRKAIVSYPTRWSELDIETHVIGLPGSESAADLLDAIALAGSTEKHSAPAQLGGFEETVYHLLR